MLPEKNIAGIITSESMGWKSGSQHSLLLHWGLQICWPVSCSTWSVGNLWLRCPLMTASATQEILLNLGCALQVRMLLYSYYFIWSKWQWHVVLRLGLISIFQVRKLRLCGLTELAQGYGVIGW
jgi:hypothetical protein